MKGTFLLVLLLKYFHQSDCCELAPPTFVCTTIPSNFPPGLSTLLFLARDAEDVGEINSTVFDNDNLISITSVIFKKAGITGIAEGAFTSFHSLKSLTLDQNKFTDINYKWLGRPSTLTELSMSENHIRVLSGAMLDGFTKLNKLDLRRNQIGSIQPHTFSNLPDLALLDLSDNNLTYLTSDMFRPLHNTNMSLQGNQWQCSCDAKDFYEFIMDLKNRSLLLHADDVTCANPPSLRGQPVWSASECSTPVSPGPPPTNAAPTTSRGLIVSKPTMDIKTDLKPTTTPSADFQPPPYTTDIVPMLITVIVVLCVVLLLVIIPAVLYRRKRNRKTVAPKDQNEPVTVGKESHEKTDATGRRRWDTETPPLASLTGLRAKSANAILFTYPFGVSGDPHVGPSLVEDGENKSGVEKEIDALMTGPGINDSVPSSVSNLQNETPLLNCDNVPYLSIGSRQSQAKNTTVDVKSPLAKLGRRMHRIATWPPTAVQWQERRKREKEQEGVENVATAWTQVEFKVPSHLDQMENVPNNYEQKKPELHQLDKSFKSEEQNASWGNDAEKQGYCKEDETQSVKDVEETSSSGDAASSSTISDDLVFRNAFANAQTREKDQKLKPLSVTLQAVNASTNSRRAESRRSGSNALSDGGSESVFVDLLHEVVQNRGRWTRDRWRQIHIHRQEQQGHK